MYNRGEKSAFTLVTLLCVVGLGLAGIALVPAPAEAATTVNQCQVINDSNAPADGQVLLGGDVSASGSCIEIATSDIVFDGQGNTITGPGSSGDGVVVGNSSASVSNVTVRNVVVEQFSNGVRISDAAGSTTVSDVDVSSVTARNNGNIGVYVDNDATSGVTVSDTTVSGNLDGVYVAGRASLDGITATNNLEGVVLTGLGSSLSDSTVNGGANGLLGVEVASAGSTVDGVTVDGTGNVGIEVTGDGVTVQDSVVQKVGGGPNEVGGISVDGADGTVVTNSPVVRISAGDGIKIVDSANVKVAFGNVANVSGSGINATRVGAPTSVEVDGMFIRGNFGLADEYGVRAVDAAGVTVVDTRIRNMSSAGVFVDRSSKAVIRDNDVFDNNRGGNPSEGGLVVNGTDNVRVEANTVQRNAFNGVYVREGVGILVVDNEIVDNCGGERGLGLFEVDDVLVARNNVSANTGTGISAGGRNSGQNVTIRDGTVSDNGGSGIEAFYPVVVDGVVANGNGNSGVGVGDGSTVRNVVARENGGYGVAVDPGSTLDNVTAAGNGDGFREGDVYADDGTSTATDLTVGENTMTFASVEITNAALSGLNASTAPAPPSGLVNIGAYVSVSTGQGEVRLSSMWGDVATVSTGAVVLPQYAALSAPDTPRQIALPRFDPVVSYSAPAAADESTLTLYRYNGTAWSPVSGATTDANADTVSASGGTGDYALFAEPASGDDVTDPTDDGVTGPTGDIELTDAGLSTTSVETGESVTVSATVENTQGATAAKTLRLRVDGISVGQRTVYVSADTNETYEFTYTPSRTGEFDVTVNNLDAGTLAVSEPTAGGSSGVTTATAADADDGGSGGSGTATATETASGSGGGGAGTATATETASGSGGGGAGATTTTAAVDTPAETAAGGDDTPEPTAGGGAGFGLVVAVTALLAAALLAVRRR
jgi:PGF-CTERM protein